jgi:hypothetical protein
MSVKDTSCSSCANDSRNGGICTEANTVPDCFLGSGWVEMRAYAAAQEPAGAPIAASVIPTQHDSVSEALTAALENAAQLRVFPRRHSHYFKPVAGLEYVDVYRVLALFEVTDPCLQHAVKKLLVAGGRGVKDQAKDIAEAIDTLTRWQEMRAEDERGAQ